MDIFFQLQSLLNFTSEFITNKDKKFGTPLRNGTWNGLVKMLIDDEIDIAVTVLSITEARSSVIDFCEPLFIDSFTFFISQKDEGGEVNWFAYFKPLHMDSWTCIISFVALATPVLYLAAKQCKDIQLKEFKLGKSLIFSVGALTFARR